MNKVTQAIETLLEKGGKKATIGEIRSFAGRPHIKTADGWKFYGKGSGTKAKSHSESHEPGKTPEASAKSPQEISSIQKSLSQGGYKIKETKQGIFANKDTRGGGTSSIIVDFDENHPAGKWYVNCQDKVITSSTSLADSRSNYQTTSAHSVKYKTVKGAQYYDSFEKVNSFINRHFAKTDKVK